MSIEESAPQPGDGVRPVWTYQHPTLSKPPTIRVEPSFKDELGRVFIGIGDWDWSAATWRIGADGSHRAIWLDEEALARLRQALDEAEAWSKRHGEDCPADCACQG